MGYLGASLSTGLTITALAESGAAGLTLICGVSLHAACLWLLPFALLLRPPPLQQPWLLRSLLLSYARCQPPACNR